jgi:hypothetical protein
MHAPSIRSTAVRTASLFTALRCWDPSSLCTASVDSASVSANALNPLSRITRAALTSRLSLRPQALQMLRKVGLF